MKTYKVVARGSGIVFADIEAENEKEALEYPTPHSRGFSHE